MTLFVEKHEYIGTLSPAVGFRVMLHHRDLHPFPENGDGFDVSPGGKVSVNIRMVGTGNGGGMAGPVNGRPSEWQGNDRLME